MTDRVDEVLWSVAEERAEEHGYPFDGTAAVLLRELLHEGAEEMEREGVTEESAEMGEALEHVREFVDEMAVAADDLGVGAFQESAFFRAKQKLCPGFFPFC